MIWNKLTEKRPLAYKKGMFDGKKSDKVLVADEFGNYFIAEMYEGFMDGSEFCDFYDTRDFKLKNIEYWVKLESPFLIDSTILTADGKPTVITRLENLKVGDTYKYNPNDVGIFKVLGRQDENWIKVVRTQSGRITGSFPWTEVYPVNEL